MHLPWLDVVCFKETPFKTLLNHFKFRHQIDDHANATRLSPIVGGECQLQGRLEDMGIHFIPAGVVVKVNA